jgi:endonuclease/exonuclease/phosphatase family metal-dependent hydrolase
VTPVLPALPRISDATRARILASPRTTALHAGFMAEIPAMAALEQGGDAPLQALPRSFTAAAWNLERCLFPEEAAAHLAPRAPALVLLSEMDSGMARTGQANTPARMAEALGMQYAFGVEFYEMALGGPIEQARATDDFNVAGWHGNAILSSAPFKRLTLIRLPEEGFWFDETLGGGNPHEPRIGTRMAIAAEIETEAGPICAVSTHLESNADAAYRHMQMVQLLDAIDAFAPDMPVLIGGDLNTGNHMPPDFDYRGETLFALAEARGYDWTASAPGVTLCTSLLNPRPPRPMRLDWFAMRGMSGIPHPLVPPVAPDGTPLSDHLMICADFTI